MSGDADNRVRKQTKREGFVFKGVGMCSKGGAKVGGTNTDLFDGWWVGCDMNAIRQK
jgi:hypothetical protein